MEIVNRNINRTEHIGNEIMNIVNRKITYEKNRLNMKTSQIPNLVNLKLQAENIKIGYYSILMVILLEWDVNKLIQMVRCPHTFVRVEKDSCSELLLHLKGFQEEMSVCVVQYIPKMVIINF